MFSAMDRLLHEVDSRDAGWLRSCHPVECELLLLGMLSRCDLRERLRRKIRAARAELQQRQPDCFCGATGGRGPCVSLLTTDGTLACGHEFHVTCALDWLRRDHSCPMCRAHASAVLLPSGQRISVSPPEASAADTVSVNWCMRCATSAGLFVPCSSDGCGSLVHADCSSPAEHGRCLQCLATAEEAV